MIGMSFGSCLVLLIIAIIVGLVVHFVFGSYVRKGAESLISKIVLGWIGAWLGPSVFGNWFEGVKIANIYIIPAFLGSFALLYLMIDLVKSIKD